jgi:hypothetical protein
MLKKRQMMKRKGEEAGSSTGAEKEGRRKSR